MLSCIQELCIQFHNQRNWNPLYIIRSTELPSWASARRLQDCPSGKMNELIALGLGNYISRVERKRCLYVLQVRGALFPTFRSST
jgi:hypothetical protein